MHRPGCWPESSLTNPGVSTQKHRFTDLSTIPFGRAFVVRPEGHFFRSKIMIFTFILAVSLALISYLFGGSFVKVAIYTGITQIIVLLVVGYVIYYLSRRFTRGRRGGVRRIPRL